jgi:hypothetical protein
VSDVTSFHCSLSVASGPVILMLSRSLVFLCCASAIAVAGCGGIEIGTCVFPDHCEVLSTKTNCDSAYGEFHQGKACPDLVPPSPCVPGCQSPLRCDAAASPPRCVRCISSANCPREMPICDTDGSCLSCGVAAGGCESLASSGLTLCAPDGSCGNCMTNADCSKSAGFACVGNRCGQCGADRDCVGIGPETCVANLCALDAETYYVNDDASVCSGQGAGTAAVPLCRLDQAITKIPSRPLIFLQGSSPGLQIMNTLPNQTQWTIVGGANATILGGTRPGISIGGNVYLRLRHLVIADSSEIGIDVAEAASIELDAVTVRGNAKGGLRVVGGSFDIKNALFAENGGTSDEMGNFIGGAYLSPPARRPGQLQGPVRFAFSTVVANKGIGVRCTGSEQRIDSSLLYQNQVGGTGGVVDVATCTLDASQTSANGDAQLSANYHLTATSPCRNALSYSSVDPLTDIDGERRPQEGRFDCGADEFTP